MTEQEKIDGVLTLLELSAQEICQLFDQQHEQERVESIFKEISARMRLEQCDPQVMAYFNDYYWIDKDDWLALKRQEGITE